MYPSLVRMAQEFSLRYTLIDGQGNFGSVDGDPPAAMRYTEARMTRLGEEMLRDINKNTVDYIPNYDETRQEPHRLAVRYSQSPGQRFCGIAVGMATNIPPHNLSEVVDALVLQLEHPDCTLPELRNACRDRTSRRQASSTDGRAFSRAYHTGRGFCSCARGATSRPRTAVTARASSSARYPTS